MIRIRKTGKRSELDQLWSQLNSLRADVEALRVAANSGALSFAGIGAGTTAGHLRTTQICDYIADRQIQRKAATDDLWDLSGEDPTTEDGDTAVAAFALLLDDQGAASFERFDAASDEEAIGALMLADLDLEDKALVGIAAFAPETDFTAALTPAVVIHPALSVGVLQLATPVAQLVAP